MERRKIMGKSRIEGSGENGEVIDQIEDRGENGEEKDNGEE